MSKALKAAIEANDEEAVRKAAKGVKDLNRKLPGAKAPLLYACEKGADKVLKALFDAGAVGEKRHTFPGDTPFAVAAEHRQFAAMRRLLELKQASDAAVRFVLENACMDGKTDLLEFVLELVKPRITIELFRLASIPSKAPALVRLLVQHGGDLRARHDRNEAKQMTPLHDLVDSGRADVIRTLVECGADVNARDGLGRTPLMVLASALEAIDCSNERAVRTQEQLARGEATLLAGEPPRTVDGLAAVRTLIELGADASLADGCGNDAIDHCLFEYSRSQAEPPPEIISALRKAGAKGSMATLELFSALAKKNLSAVRKAIGRGADVNRLSPPPVQVTPLTWAASCGGAEGTALVRTLSAAGADPNKRAQADTPLMEAARSGNLEAVKELVAAGANVHAVCESGEYIANAYSAAEGHDDVKEYLRSLGAGNPRRDRSEPLKPGVGSWNDFSELLVKTTPDRAAEALAGMIGGKVQTNAYGQSVLPGKRAYVVVRPKGMDWCNVFQLAPPRLRFEDSNQTEAFGAELAKACGAPVLAIDYSDTSDAASVVRIEASGKKTRDKGWDHETLKEMVEAMGEEAPAWAKKQLARTDEDEPSSSERLVRLAEQERFVVAAFGLSCEPGRKLDVEFTGYGPEAFDGVAFVSN